MIRPIIIVVNLLIAFWVKMLATEPSAEVTAPASVNAGESFVVNVTVKPNGETGFMRFAMELQPGWTAEKIETAGSSFYFEKNSANDNYSAKFLWSRVGEVSELKVSFRVSVPASASGDIQLPCKISYTLDNLPENVQLNPLTITVKNSAAGNTIVSVPDSTAKPAAKISITRTVPAEPVAGEFIVDIFIDKDDLVNFGKIQDSLPAGFTAKKVMTDGSTFSFENGIVKFYWPVLPKKSTLHIQYKVVASPDMSGAQLITGYFSYVENESGKISRIPASTVTLKENAAMVRNEEPNKNAGPDSTPNAQGDNTQQAQATKQTNNQQDNGQQQNAQANNQQDNSATKQTNNQQDNSQNAQANNQANKQDNGQQSAQSASSAGVTYSVQIAAMSRMVPVEYYSSTFNISGTINMEQSGGLNRYTNGSFNAYAEARNHREAIRSKGVTDAFVAAYSNGKRITVQEALMITNQKWIR